MAEVSLVKTNRNTSIDLLKMVLAIFVVAIHSNIQDDLSIYFGQALYSGIFRIAVPIFYIITGYYFVRVDSVLKLKKWVLQLASLYGFWMLFYAYHWIEPEKSFFSHLNCILFGTMHLWFILAMILAGIMIFVCRNKSLIFPGLLTILFLVIGPITQYLGNFNVLDDSQIGKILLNPRFHRNFIITAFPYMWLGYYMRIKNPFGQISNLFLGVIFIASSISLCGEALTMIFFQANIIDSEQLFSIIILCPIIFEIFLRFNLKLNISQLGQFSAAIYFIHMLFIDVFSASQKGFMLMIYTLLCSSLCAILIVKTAKRWKFLV